MLIASSYSYLTAFYYFVIKMYIFIYCIVQQNAVFSSYNIWQPYSYFVLTQMIKNWFHILDKVHHIHRLGLAEIRTRSYIMSILNTVLRIVKIWDTSWRILHQGKNYFVKKRIVVMDPYRSPGFRSVSNFMDPDPSKTWRLLLR